MDGPFSNERPRRFDTVLFDAGGVLLDLDYAYLKRLLEARRLEATEDALERAEAIARTAIDRHVREGGSSGDAWRDYFRVIFGRVGAPPSLHEELIDALWEAHQRVGLWTVPVRGAVDIVSRLHGAGFRIGVVSNAEGRVERDLASAGFAGILDAVVDSHVVGVAKPDPRIFAIALERLRARPDTAVFVGDVPAVDVVGARAAGIAPVLLDRHDLYPTADAPRLRSLDDLPGWLEGEAPA
ncbi:MAG: HAD family hydrolase [Acidobacteriia bacterium]|nr:HAD family hydrolase [Terriglobia bacterium]